MLISRGFISKPTNNGTIIRAEITCKKILLQKSIEFDIPFK